MTTNVRCFLSHDVTQKENRVFAVRKHVILIKLFTKKIFVWPIIINHFTSSIYRDVCFLPDIRSQPFCKHSGWLQKQWFGHVILRTLHIKKYVIGILDLIQALSCDNVYMLELVFSNAIFKTQLQKCFWIFRIEWGIKYITGCSWYKIVMW